MMFTEQSRLSCQYYVLSPRPSIESPSKRPAADPSDENRDLNVIIGSQQGLSGKPVPRLRPQSPEAASRLGQMPCQRQATTATETKRCGASPAPVQRSVLSTPDKKHIASVSDLGDVMDYAEASFANISVRSNLSCTSRLTELSRRTMTRRTMSSKELEDIELEKKRKELRDLFRQNEVNCRKALLATEVSFAGKAHCLNPPTFPKAFSLSVSNISRTPRGGDGGSSDHEDSTKLRCKKSEPWKPKLTVPKGPELRSVCRRGTGLLRVNSCPPESFQDFSSASRPQTPRLQTSRPQTPRAATPERRTQDIPAAKTRAPTPERKGIAAVKSARAPTPERKGSAQAPASDASAARRLKEEKALRLKLLATQQKEEALKSSKEKMFVFSAAKPAAKPVAKHPKGTPSQVAEQGILGSMCSVGSIRSESVERRRPLSARERRPSFGSTTERPCLR